MNYLDIVDKQYRIEKMNDIEKKEDGWKTSFGQKPPKKL